MTRRGLLRSARRRTKLALSHIGQEVVVERPDGTATEDKFGKVGEDDVTWSEVATDEVAYRAYPNYDNERGRARATGGRVRTDSPNILLELETDVQEGDRITFDDGETYEIDRLQRRASHTETRVTRVQP